MSRLILYLFAVALLASGLAWLADRPGALLIEWQGYRAETSVFRAVVILLAAAVALLAVWSALRRLLRSPVSMGRFLSSRRGKRGLDAISNGMIAVGSGDAAAATRYAALARKTLPNEPLTHLLRAQAGQLVGDRAGAKRIFEAMLTSPDTEVLGLRGLFAEANRDGDTDAAKRLAERALRVNPRLAWPLEALFDLQCRREDWTGALGTLSAARKSQTVSKVVGDRRRAVLLTAQARTLEETDPDRALTFALDAHGLAPDLIPAALIAGRVLSARGNVQRAARVLERTWVRSPHPDVAHVYAYARAGDSPRDRLQRVRRLSALTPHSIEGPIAVATAAVEARAFDEAQAALEALDPSRLTRRACLLMAHGESERDGGRNGGREWLARAVTAARDPEWTADGVTADDWSPLSPVTHALDAFQWRVPQDSPGGATSERLARRLAELRSAAGAAAPVPIHVPDSPPQMAGDAEMKALAPSPGEGAADAAAKGDDSNAPGGREAGSNKDDAPPLQLPSPGAAPGDHRGYAPPDRNGARARHDGDRARTATGNGSNGANGFPHAPDDPGPNGDGDETGDGRFVEDAKRPSRF